MRVLVVDDDVDFAESLNDMLVAEKYEVLVAARESDIELLVASYQDAPYLELSIDGLQPEKGHETLYVVRELVKKRVWFATPLLSSAAGDGSWRR